MGKTGGQYNYETGRVERGKMPKGSTEDAYTFTHNTILAALGRGLSRKKGRH